jgi:hypothetical protein
LLFEPEELEDPLEEETGGDADTPVICSINIFSASGGKPKRAGFIAAKAEGFNPDPGNPKLNEGFDPEDDDDRDDDCFGCGCWGDDCDCA